MFGSFSKRAKSFQNELPVSAVISVDLTVDATKARRAGASVAVDTVGAVGSVLAGVTLTFVDVLLTTAATKPWQTGACESVDAIVAQSSITAGI